MPSLRMMWEIRTLVLEVLSREVGSDLYVYENKMYIYKLSTEVGDLTLTLSIATLTVQMSLWGGRSL